MRQTSLLACVATVAVIMFPPAVRSATLTPVYSFKGGNDGSLPRAALLYEDGYLYGTTESGGGETYNDPESCCGTVFKINLATGAETVLNGFNSIDTGAAPLSGLTKVRKTGYGTTFGGGQYGGGTVYLTGTLGGASVLYNFNGDVTGGTDAWAPVGGLINVGGMLYGTTSGGGGGVFGPRGGTIYKIDPTTGAESVLHAFVGGSDGSDPEASLVNVDGVFYGTTSAGGSTYGCCGGGTLFKFDPGNNTETVLYAFTGGTDGSGPDAALINVGEKLYGVTGNDGDQNCSCGTVFMFDLTTGTKTTLHTFLGANDGAGPQAALLRVGGTLYGTTSYGGGNCDVGGCGTIFSIELRTHAYNVVYSFTNGSDGAFPEAALIKANGALYGTTSWGGGTGCGGVGCGTVFRLTP